MPPTTAWTASVWGKAAEAKPAVPLKDGEEECVICFDAATQIKFKPCKHGACHACVDKLRAANIFKARAPRPPRLPAEHAARPRDRPHRPATSHRLLEPVAGGCAVRECRRTQSVAVQAECTRCAAVDARVPEAVRAGRSRHGPGTGAPWTGLAVTQEAPRAQVDAGVRCPFCRQFVEGYDTMAGCARTTLCSMQRLGVQRRA